jgi:hypothetical protein
MTIGEEANLSGVRWPLSPTSPQPQFLFFFLFLFFKKKKKKFADLQKAKKK